MAGAAAREPDGPRGWLAAYASLTVPRASRTRSASGVARPRHAARLARARRCSGSALRGLAPRARRARSASPPGSRAHGLVLHWIYVVTVRYGHAPAAVGVVALVAPRVLHRALRGALRRRERLARRAAARLGPFAARRALDRASSTAALVRCSRAFRGRRSATRSTPTSSLLGARALGRRLRALASRARSAAPALARLLRREAGHARGARSPASPRCSRSTAPARRSAASRREPGGRTLRVAVLQGNIDQGVKWSPEWAERTLAIYEELTRAAAAQRRAARGLARDGGARLARRRARRSRRASRRSRARRGAALVVGAVGPRRFDPSTASWRGALLRQRLRARRPSAARLDRYDKSASRAVRRVRAVPRRCSAASSRAVATRHRERRRQRRGGAAHAVAVPDRATAGRRSDPSGIPICYELLFPDLDAALRGRRGAGAARDHERRLVRAHRGAAPVPRDDGAPLGGDRAAGRRARRTRGSRR